jgi:hypothetical protein
MVFVRHPGAGRDPVATTLAHATRLLDSGLRRNDASNDARRWWILREGKDADAETATISPTLLA